MKWIKIITKTLIFCFICFIVCLIGLYTYAFFSPKLELKTANRIYLYDDKNNLVFQGSGSSKWVNIEDISPNLINAIISVEDKSFYKHHGFDYLRIAKAMMMNVKNKSIIQGASTISQQYIKNMYLDFSKTWSRKLEEAFLTLELEVHYNKDEILEGYLNTINYGQGNLGIANASKFYFNKEPNELSLEESLMLAGIPKNPSKYNPISDYDACTKRAKIVAKAMLNNNYISQEEYNNLFLDNINIYGENSNNNLKMLMYYQDAVLDELYNIKEIPNSLIKSGGLKIYTNLNMDAQSILEKNIIENMANQSMQVASVIINPQNGEVIALSGGKDYTKSEYNRATKAKRQVGSTIKPFLYYTALENNMVSSSKFSSEATTFSLESGKSYTPSNYGDKYANKNITMSEAIAVSDNVYAVKTHLFLGTEALVNTAKLAGIKETLPAIPSLALGTCELNMLDYANGYTTIASGGYQNNIHLINKIEDMDGNTLYEYKNKKRLVLNPNYTYILNEMLTSTTNSAFKDYTNPTALTIANKLSRKYAIKTGTTNTDFWTIGYNPDILMLVWSGNDDGSEVSSTNSKITKNIWADTVETILKDQDESWYEKPDNVVSLALDAVSGEETHDASKTAIFYYVKGSENLVFKEE